MKREYRICKLRILRTLLDRGILLPLEEGIRTQLRNAYVWDEKAQVLASIEQLEKDIEDWEVNSLAPIEIESSKEEMVVLALLSRIPGGSSDGTP